MSNTVSMGTVIDRLTALGRRGTFYSVLSTSLPTEDQSLNSLQGIVVQFFEFCCLTLANHGCACS